MSIDDFYTTSIALKRMSWSNDSGGEIAGTSFNGHIQQADQDMAEFIGEAVGDTFAIWCAKDTDVETGDTLTIASGNYAGTYNVRQIQLNAIGANAHMEITCVRVKV